MKSWLIVFCLSVSFAVCHGTNCSNSTLANNSTECEEELPYESCPDPSLCEEQSHGDHVGLAFGLTIAAGLSTTIGALLPFIPCIKPSNTKYLAAGLALAAGVMLYVSFTEIWTKAKQNFCCISVVHYDLLTTVCFFGGIIITVLLDLLVALLQRIDCGCSCNRRKSVDIETGKKKVEATNPIELSSSQGISSGDSGIQNDEPPTPDSPADSQPISEDKVTSSESSEEKSSEIHSPSEVTRRNSYSEMVDQVHHSFKPQGPPELEKLAKDLGKDAKKLHRMGILTGLAIGIHNFPEGLATFVATLADPTLGVALCIAIALHNIPEGICVAMPVYYATGKRWKGFLWAFLSGVSEPLGALLGWLALKEVFGPLVYAIAFGLISGMMVFISLKELLPTARKFDTTGGHLVNAFLVAGMVIMAVSLILFLY